MTRMRLDSTRIREDLISGLVAAYGRYLEQVPGASGVMRAGGICAGKVSIVIGGGSGHYPAFGGLVGDGLADAAAMGDIFASPSAEQVYRVARAVEGGAGVLLTYGNYSGDCLNFGIAQERLRLDGVDCRTVLVTDDVASSPREQPERRRGIAGGVCVFKMAGAVAAEGAGLEEVERVAMKANSAARTLGVAFAGCTLPGQKQPLFEIAGDNYELGLGIHGEPGVKTVSSMGTEELAETLVMPLVDEAPSWGDGRAAAVLNGLGSTSYEELFVLWSKVAPVLEEVGVIPVLPEVGEFVTSLDMAGCSLTLCWLDDELERLWRAPAGTPAFRRGDVTILSSFARRATNVGTERSDLAQVISGPESEKGAATARMALEAMLQTVQDNEESLGRLDAVAGDGDHGSGMVRGLGAAVAVAEETKGGLGTVLRAAGRAFADQAGGASGALWGLLLEAVADDLGDITLPDSAGIVRAVRRATEVLARAGGAKVGDKSMLDALAPFAEELRGGAGPLPLAEAWRRAAGVASAAAQSTAGLMPRVGRARPLGERSLGTPDPGAVSLALCLEAVGRVLAVRAGGDGGSELRG